MAILGLVSTETYDATRFKNIRRSVQYQYPNGAAVLTGLLSLMDGEETNDPQFSHWEKRHGWQRQVTATNALGGGVAVGPFTTSTTGAITGTPGTCSTSFTWTKDSFYRVYVDDTAPFRVGHVLQIATLASGNIVGRVTAVDATHNFVVCIALATVASVANNNSTACELEVLVIGSSSPQGVLDLSTEIYNLPVEFANYTQIFRTPFSFTGTALKTPLKFDESGPYQDKAKEHSVYHMEEIEKALLFGIKYSGYGGSGSGTSNPSDGTGLPVTTTGGVIWHLRQWEAGTYNTSAGRTIIASSDSDDDKRIIDNASGTMDEDTYDGYLERLFRYTNNTSNEKLVLCGSGFLKTLNLMYRNKAVLMTDIPMKDTFGMNVVGHLTPFGTVYYKTHPLFSQNPALRYSGLFLDVRNLRYRAMVGRDTTLLANRQPNDADYRKDEWFTEAGLEMWYPESCMLINNVRNFVA